MVATYYYHYDALGSTERLTDASQNTTDTYTYTAFGNGVGGKNSTKNSYGWLGRIGYQYDGFGIISAVRARWYKYDTGRWISQDPIGFRSGDWNLYQYAQNNPTSVMDPSGMVIAKCATCCDDMDKFITNQICTSGFLLACGPVDCLIGGPKVKKAPDCESEADRLATTYYTVLTEEHEAFRHCYASGCLTQFVSCSCAAAIGYEREYWQHYCVPEGTGNYNSDRDGQQGLYNNRVGRECAGCVGVNSDNNGAPLNVKDFKSYLIWCCRNKVRQGNVDLGGNRHPDPLPPFPERPRCQPLTHDGMTLLNART